MVLKNNGNSFDNSGHLTPQQIQQMLMDPAIRAWDNTKLWRAGIALMRNPFDHVLQAIFAHLLSKQRELYVLSGNPYWPNYPPIGTITGSAGDIKVGSMFAGDPVAFSANRLFCGTGIFARIGAGKSSFLAEPIRQLIDQDYLVIVFQQKDEYNNFATEPALAGKVLPLRDSECMISPFEPAIGVSMHDHNNSVIDTIGRCSGRMYAQRLTLDLNDKYSKKLPSGSYTPLDVLINIHENFVPGRGSVEAYYKESMLYALREIQKTFGGIFDYYSSDFLEKIFNRTGLVAIQSGAPLAAYTFFVTIFIQYIYLLRKAARFTVGTFKKIIIILEDATMITDEKELGGTSPLTNLAFTARAYNIGIVYINHTIATSVSQKLLSNLENIFLLGLSGEDLRRIQQLLNCTPEQAKVIPLLQPGQFVALIPSMWPMAVLGQFPYNPSPRKLTEDERLKIVRSFLGTVRTVKSGSHRLPIIVVPASSAASSVPSLNSNQMQFLILAATGKPMPLGKLYEVIGLAHRDGKKIVDSLEQKGLIRIYAFSTGKVGGKVSFVEVTDASWRILIARGFSRSKSLTGGGFLHNLAATLINIAEKKRGMTVNFEIDLKGVRIDVESRDNKSGKRVFINIGVSSPQREADVIEKIFAMPVMNGNRFVLVGLDGPFTKQVKDILKKKGWKSDALNRLEVRVIADFIVD